jgi:hypothetical protein
MLKEAIGVQVISVFFGSEGPDLTGVEAKPIQYCSVTYEN